MKGLPFCEEMVKAWMEGRKSVTRRLIRPKRGGVITGLAAEPCCVIEAYGGGRWNNPSRMHVIRPPYRPGETVYIKEAWWQWGQWVKNGLTKTGKQAWKFKAIKTFGSTVSFKKHDKIIREETGWHKRPSRFMPEWAARSHARIVSVRPERVQEITDDEALREGFLDIRYAGEERIPFIALWDRLHPGTWNSNPWVWRIELEKMDA